MEQILIDYQYELAFGVLLNFAMSFGFGIYKIFNVDFMSIAKLMDRYPIKPNYLKTVVLWFVPYFGACVVFYELFILQKAINRGKTVYEYMEDKISREYARQSSKNDRND
ncbi:MAG: hypothetical protein LBQ52_09470 [Helicobacteraceae bacterium]|jgi:hypothetical protein|nr:hypothetical protein [Helicobacteraceae bacterium]